MRRRDYIYWALIAGLVAAVALTGRGCSHSGGGVTRVDTVVVRDTIRDTVLAVRSVRTVRVDTVWLRVAEAAVGEAICSVQPKTAATIQATDSVRVEIPIEQKVYETDDYRAVVEGFRPVLKEVEIRRSTVLIDRETVLPPQKPRRWGIGIQAGYGITAKGFAPYIGIGVQYSVITW